MGTGSLNAGFSSFKGNTDVLFTLGEGVDREFMQLLPKLAPCVLVFSLHLHVNIPLFTGHMLFMAREAMILWLGSRGISHLFSSVLGDSPAGCELLKLFGFTCLSFPIPFAQEFS